MYFPQAIEPAGGTLYKTMALDFLSKWPQLSDVQRAKNKTIQLFYSTHNSRSAVRIKERQELIRSTIPLTSDQAVIRSCLIIVKMLIGQLSELNSAIDDSAIDDSAIDEFDMALRELYNNHEDKSIFTRTRQSPSYSHSNSCF
jgi:hypothetical protein